VHIGTSSWSFIDAGTNHSMGILITGLLYSWGQNNAGQLGDGTTTTRSSPVPIGSSSWSAISGGSFILWVF
jgi:alpha-tubulin suppressor-like RCC1 family protein